MLQKIIDKIKAALTNSSLLHGAALAALAALTTFVMPLFQAWSAGAGAPPFDWTAMWHITVGAFGLYIIKNMLFGSSGVNPPASK